LDPMDKELKQKLAPEPLNRNGFDDELKSRIEERLDEKEAAHAKWLPRLSFMGAASGLLALLIVCFGQPSGERPEAASAAPGYADAADAPFIGPVKPLELQSALLLGLRTDHPAEGSREAYSTYRTVLVAPEDGRLQKVAEGQGILMPYKQDFWRVAPERLALGGRESLVLTAYKAKEQAAEAQAKSAWNGPVVRDTPIVVEEKLLFAGNRYLALSQKVESVEDGKPVLHDYVWVKEIEQIKQSARTVVSLPHREPHVAMRDVFGKGAEVSSPRAAEPFAEGESWTIVRKQGRWAAEQAIYSKSADESYQYMLMEVPSALPELVVAHDKLAADWEGIRQYQPLATDAFSSPTEDMVAVVGTDRITFYPYQDRIVPKDTLTIPLAENETVIMSQWAVDKYVPLWKKQVGELLQP